MGDTFSASESQQATGTADWLRVCRNATRRIEAMMTERPVQVRRLETGTRGSGGDYTLEIDAAAEAIVFDELSTLHDSDGLDFLAVSEERGEMAFGSASDVHVVIDPIDGSLNAKRGLPHYALSIAVAAGATMGDVFFGYVYEFGPREEWWAVSGDGAYLNGTLLDRGVGEIRGDDGRLEVLGIESADPRWLRGSIDALETRAYRLRAHGALASSLCQVAAGRFDGLVSMRRCRAVDVAAAQLVVREAGGLVSFPAYEEPLSAPLDVLPHSPVAAARTSGTLADLATLVT
jgi:myo-inositol-1(or 4)-monophosphatase